MSRRHFFIPCEGAGMAATMEGPMDGQGAVLLIVSGGHEVRSGAWGGQAWLAAQIAARGHCVLRFDRRGVGDSEGANATYRGSGPDIASAVAFLRQQHPGQRIVAMGNCDAASALMLNGGSGADGLILCNPWTIEGEDEGADEESRAGAQVASLRAHYRARLTSPAALLRLFSGKVSLRSLAGSVLAMARRRPKSANTLVDAMAKGLEHFSGPVAFLLAENDRTAKAFRDAWPSDDKRISTCPQAGHSFVEDDARLWLVDKVAAELARQ